MPRTIRRFGHMVERQRFIKRLLYQGCHPTDFIGAQHVLYFLERRCRLSAWDAHLFSQAGVGSSPATCSKGLRNVSLPIETAARTWTLHPMLASVPASVDRLEIPRNRFQPRQNTHGTHQSR